MNAILQTFRDRLAAAGLVVETLEADGVLHRCACLSGGLSMPLTLRGLSGMVKAPNQVRQGKRRFGIPNAVRRFAAYQTTALRRQSTCRASVRRAAFAYWRGTTSSIREDWRPHLGRGALRPAFFFIPKPSEFPMISFSFSKPGALPAQEVRP